jgi:predicted AAA+ superfamily ATPase
LAVRLQAQADPEALVARAPALVLDEVQRARDLLLAVKRAVDRDRPRRPGRFVLTGSANLLMLQTIGETLAGRASNVTLWPLTANELAGAGGTGLWGELLAARFARWRDIVLGAEAAAADWREAVQRGGFPVPARELATRQQRALWFSGYVQTYLERDLPELRAVENLADFRRLAQAACLRLGALLNQAELGRDAGLSQPQVHRFLNVLEASYLAVRLPAYAVNRSKRLIKAPKLYWSDPALALHLRSCESFYCAARWRRCAVLGPRLSA